MTATEDKNARFWDKIAAKYAEDPIADEASYKIKLDITREYLTSDMNVLEIGCGTGSTAILHAPFVKHIHATDISKNMIEIGRARAKDAGVENISFEAVSAEDLTGETGSYDAVLGLNFLHLVEDRQVVLEKILTLLKPGGVFISGTACIGDFMPIFRLIIPLGRAIGKFPLVKVFNREAIISEFEHTGFKIVHQWQPKKNKSLFMVAKAPEAAAAKLAENEGKLS